MAATFQFTATGASEVQKRTAVLAEAFGGLEPLMADFGVALESGTIDRFDREQAPDGSAWAPSLRARTEGGKTLTDTSQLRSSITHLAHADSVEVGTNKIYAGVHQFGATIRPKSAQALRFQLPGGLGFRNVQSVTIPARPFLGLSADDEEELLALTEDYARDAGGAGFA